jgi:uncharacterized protein YbdZ (MbtH family)
MSRFAIRDAGSTVAAGMCIDYVKKQWAFLEPFRKSLGKKETSERKIKP